MHAATRRARQRSAGSRSTSDADQAVDPPAAGALRTVADHWDDDVPFDVRVERSSAGRAIVIVTGELDIAGVPTLAAEVRELAVGPTPVVIDLRSTTFLDVSGVHLLVTLSEEAAAAGWCLGVLPALAPEVERILELTRCRPLIAFVEPYAGQDRATRPPRLAVTR